MKKIIIVDVLQNTGCVFVELQTNIPFKSILDSLTTISDGQTLNYSFRQLVECIKISGGSVISQYNSIGFILGVRQQSPHTLTFVFDDIENDDSNTFLDVLISYPTIQNKEMIEKRYDPTSENHAVIEEDIENGRQTFKLSTRDIKCDGILNSLFMTFDVLDNEIKENNTSVIESMKSITIEGKSCSIVALSQMTSMIYGHINHRPTLVHFFSNTDVLSNDEIEITIDFDQQKLPSRVLMRYWLMFRVHE